MNLTYENLSMRLFLKLILGHEPRTMNQLFYVGFSIDLDGFSNDLDRFSTALAQSFISVLCARILTPSESLYVKQSRIFRTSKHPRSFAIALPFDRNIPLSSSPYLKATVISVMYLFGVRSAFRVIRF